MDLITESLQCGVCFSMLDILIGDDIYKAKEIRFAEIVVRNEQQTRLTVEPNRI